MAVFDVSRPLRASKTIETGGEQIATTISISAKTTAIIQNIRNITIAEQVRIIWQIPESPHVTDSAKILVSTHEAPPGSNMTEL